MRLVDIYVKTLGVLLVEIWRCRNGKWFHHTYVRPYPASVQRLQTLVQNMDSEIKGYGGVLVLTFSF